MKQSNTPKKKQKTQKNQKKTNSTNALMSYNCLRVVFLSTAPAF